ncbi:hypothetical protein V6N13_054645 [Hibiscus sabdariffa]|uniref:Proteasome subunit beta n=1 Tax=Hibiscus sabdariffa TaxID=183260 RepID=A0ABR2DYV6_9ROSI
MKENDFPAPPIPPCSTGEGLPCAPISWANSGDAWSWRVGTRINNAAGFYSDGNDFAVVAADTSAVHSILVHKSNEDKIMILDSHKLIAASGESGDRVQFTEYIQKNVALYQFRNGIPLTTAAAANFTRGELATALRKNPYFVNILLAGYDKETGPSLYYIDYIATLHKVDKGAFGYGSYFSLAMMDRHYHSGMTVEEAIDLVDKCIMEIRSRLVVAPPNFVIKIVDKDGAREYAWRESVKDAAVASA